MFVFTSSGPDMEITDHRILGLNRIFSEQELLDISESRTHIISILSYFATSLFDKNNVEDVLWDITENCIGRLGLEDCVIYLLDKRKSLLVQKAAYGNKECGERKILSPITIPLGQGIVGHVAVTGQPEIVEDVTQDRRYILDDLQRNSELTVPIMLDGRVIGIIDSEHSEKDFFTPYHLFLFELIAQLAVKKLAHISQDSRGSFTNDNAYYKQLCALLEKEKIYRDENLSLSAVAEQLSISANYLSQLINSLSNSNFPDLINRYRVKEAMKWLTHPDYKNYTVAGIGYESGFNSTSAFYAAFKKHTGITPTEYRNTGNVS
ncbi:helix-turn-helix domain-containing protein [Sinomicrobium weinanense]|uniref:Helix-turn-helix domain-containing protein n=1 Tax=Sinomicrobium weinanense TaxID=2842200 RepID=A0A926JSS5_9FLAO|nr:helix-turn-helix domain-containing protein [Sinomicrobium weinanense]MBC9796649.1 helix-turn-helix domain-containing protein [Sinomicrobium weinanense]MBU3124898.1 helix-turn-helix domain-containing protein [Sinomicrobium weinanense]